MVPMLKVETPCRLHLGQIDLNGSLGRLMVGWGSFRRTKTVIQAEIASNLSVNGWEKERVLSLARTFLAEMGFKEGPAWWCKRRSHHMGLGSGTQALAVGAALFHLYDQDYSVAELAGSAVGDTNQGGIGIFQSGGFSGRRNSARI